MSYLHAWLYTLIEHMQIMHYNTSILNYIYFSDKVRMYLHIYT